MTKLEQRQQQTIRAVLAALRDERMDSHCGSATYREAWLDELIAECEGVLKPTTAQEGRVMQNSPRPDKADNKTQPRPRASGAVTEAEVDALMKALGLLWFPSKLLTRHEARCALEAVAPLWQERDRLGWKEATIAWSVCASLHREYAKGKDPLFKTRQADFVKHENAARSTLKSIEAKANDRPNPRRNIRPTS